ncbi:MULTISPECIES: hypothetical protein [Streptomyces]|uniref:Uncharacterized protein n=1 Tax=Streptomyces luteosporeus TaxID=173856 RepID=A0ABP6G0G1_9ACTN
MTGSIRTRLAAALGTLALAAGGAVIAAPAAHATPASCANYLAGSNPARNTSVGDLACAVGGLGLPKPGPGTLCNALLTKAAAISATRSDSACTMAGN